MSNRTEEIQKHTTDMLAAERHILEAVQRQRGDSDLQKHPEALRLVQRIEGTLDTHVKALEGLAEGYGGESQSAVKKAVTEALGAAAGLYDKMRSQKVSRMLRDDYTSLSLAAMGYTTYHTFGLAVGEERIASLALMHLKDLTPLLVDISKVLPVVTAAELSQENDFPVDVSTAQQAVSNTQQAWSTEVTEST